MFIFCVNDHVVRKGTNGPVGIVEEVNGNLSVTVLWGVIDGETLRSEELQENLQIFSQE
jgi:hypothetical protein